MNISLRSETSTWLAVDCGTSRLRIWLMHADGTVLGEVSSKCNIAQLDADQFYSFFIKLAEPFLWNEQNIPVLACGMICAKQGWQEAPYLSVPCHPLNLYQAVTIIPQGDERFNLHVMPGVKQKKPADVVRGEETQIAGFLNTHPQFDGVLCLAGTHTKWVRISAKEIVNFRTFMTGELYYLLSRQSVLKYSVADPGWSEPDFLEAVDDAISSPHKLSARLFGLRAEGLINEMPADVARARLSGYLIGLELSGAKPYWLGQDLVAIGAPKLSGLYAIALKAQGLSCRMLRDDDMALEGLRVAHKALQ
tara:strand:+ start:124 stop:1044 length:921 start_codon:yes stop_codon:yes gene_type:complete